MLQNKLLLAIIILLLTLTTSMVQAVTSASIKGYVRDAKTNQFGSSIRYSW